MLAGGPVEDLQITPQASIRCRVGRQLSFSWPETVITASDDMMIYGVQDLHDCSVVGYGIECGCWLWSSVEVQCSRLSRAI
jgi:hypothetical protein